MKNMIERTNLTSSLRFLLVLLTLLVVVSAADAAPYTVNTTNESGTGSLRDAIGQANINPGADTIDFAAGVTGTTTLASLLPTITGDLTISGPGSSLLTVSGNSSFRVFFIGPGVTVSISGLTISNGSGGGILNAGLLTITSSTFSGNSSTGNGGGITNSGTLTVNTCTFTGNSAATGGGIGGAGLITVSNCTISGNSATGSGGGISNGGTLTVTSSTISGNSAGTTGAGITNAGTLTITSSTISGNSATGFGGGIINAGPLTATNSTISGNSGTRGGGIFNAADLMITSSTLSGNLASIDGGGIYNVASATFKNSIIANSPAGGNFAGPVAITAAGVNFSTDGTCPGFAQVTPAELNLGPLQDNGGPTLTHALLAGSFAIDAVTDCTDIAGNLVTTDQRGNHRPEDGDLDGTESCDAGSFEAPRPILVECLRDNAPTVSCPGDITVAATSPDGAVVTYSAPVCLDCDCDHRTPTQIAGLAAGSTFPVGTTVNTYQVIDGGQTGTCSFSVTVVAPSKCPLPQGYWKNNPSAWPVTSLTLGGATYSQAELLAILNTPAGTGKNADASLILAYQLIAAKLNVANGSDPAPISATISAADAVLSPLSGKLPYQVKSSSAIGQQIIPLAALLEQYNKTLLTPACTP